MYLLLSRAWTALKSSAFCLIGAGKAETIMLSIVLLSAALSLGQDQALAPVPAAPPPPAVSPPSSPTPDRWFVMKCLQGTWPGWCLDSERMQITGWTDMSFTASSVEHS